MPNNRTPRELLLAALERRQLTGYRASRELAWVVFPAYEEGGTSLEVIHVPRLDRFRVVSIDTSAASTSPATTIGDFGDSDAAAACVQDALAAAMGLGNASLGSSNGTGSQRRGLGLDSRISGPHVS